MCNVCFMIIIIFRNKMKADKITCEDFFRKEKLMELMQGLLTRRSVRQYTDQAVPVSDIRDIVTAGMYAPSARHQLIWKFVVVTDREKLERLGTELKTAPMAKTAAFAVAVCADLNGAASPITGFRTARRRRRTFCWLVTRRGWARCGSACTRTPNAKTS